MISVGVGHGDPVGRGDDPGLVSSLLEGNQGIVLNLKNLSLEKLNLFGSSKKKEVVWGLGEGKRRKTFIF